MHKPTFALVAGLVLLFVPAAWGRTDAPPTSCHPSERTLAALTSYDDEIEDSGNAPDFCGGEAVTNDHQRIMIGIHAHNRSGLVPGDTRVCQPLNQFATPATDCLGESYRAGISDSYLLRIPVSELDRPYRTLLPVLEPAEQVRIGPAARMAI
jgi:hypothetical protein